MAIGARITSENLSGKTATVTFTPYTGQTSGSTINLGTKTIPFNNINTHPYGVYNLYFAEYDYTYTLTVNKPDTSVQSFVFVSQMVNSDNLGAAVLNFNDFTAEVIDLGISSYDWYCSDIYELTNSGYMYYFRGESDSDDRLVMFTDAENIEIGRYSGTTDSASRNTLEGRWVTYEDVDNGVFKYSNGVSVYTYTWNPETHYIDIEWDYDATTSDESFIIKKRGNSPLSGWTHNGDGESFIMKPDGTVIPFKTWSDGTNIIHHIAPSSDFINVITEIQGETDNTYTNFEIYDTSGNILETVSLTGATYNQYENVFHGTNKRTIVFSNYLDVDVAYKIIHYNSNTGNLIETSHDRGTAYQDIEMQGSQNFWVSGEGANKGAVVIKLSNSGQWTNYGKTVAFCDIMYMFNNQTSFTTYTFANDESGKRINSWGLLSDVYRIECVNSDDIASVLTIMSGSTRIESLNINVADVYQYNTHYLGNKSIHQIYTTDANTVSYKYVNELGVVTDSMTYMLSDPWASTIDSKGQNSYIRVSTEGNIGFYVYSGSTGFTQTDYYNNVFTPSYYATNTFKTNSDMVVAGINGSTGFRIINSTGITQQFSFPEYDDYTINIGATKFMFVYQDINDNNTVKIRLYDFNGTLLNSGTTTWTGWDNTFGVNERFIVYKRGIDGLDEIYLVSEENITSVTVQNTDDDYEINDYIYND